VVSGLKIVRFYLNDNEGFGILEADNNVTEIEDPGNSWCRSELVKTGREYQLQSLKLLAPCQPSKIICLGLNYRSHAEEMQFELPKKPIIFMKPSTAVIGSGQAISYPPQSSRVDYEAELGVVIGRLAYRVKSAEALNYVFGYTCANDVTARDKQPAQGQWTYAKSFDTFCPLGPVIETAIVNPEELQIRGYLNGKLVQEGSTADHIFTVAEIIEFISGCMTLLPGDVIITGTPSGIGPMDPGDQFNVTIDGIGTLSNPVKDSDSNKNFLKI
jgi:2-keto-4-pentenoate hydratase/2-oxohepta-3-ene-1,7-dioic acid hydratase in catechol pathway